MTNLPLEIRPRKRVDQHPMEEETCSKSDGGRELLKIRNDVVSSHWSKNVALNSFLMIHHLRQFLLPSFSSHSRKQKKFRGRRRETEKREERNIVEKSKKGGKKRERNFPR
jgi:hypothetical protein